jgi:hypothetical protein
MWSGGVLGLRAEPEPSPSAGLVDVEERVDVAVDRDAKEEKG